MLAGLLLIAAALSAPPADTAAEEKSVREFLATRQAAFNREDVAFLISHFTDDGEHIDSTGKSVKGKANLEKRYRELFSAPAHHGVTTIQTIDEVRCVTPDVAVVNASYRLMGLKDDQGKPLPDREGRSFLVLVKNGNDWLIDLLRADIKVPAAAPSPTKVDGK